MKIGDLARRTGLSPHTLRYYEQIGLLPPAPRANSRHREYDPSVLDWIAFLRRLRTTGMPIRDMVRYAELRAQGPGTEAARRDLLTRHRERVRSDVAELRASLAVLDAKIAGYGDRTDTETNDADQPETGRGPLRPRPARPR